LGKIIVLFCALAWLRVTAWAQIHPPQPGWNLLSPQQDVQLGKEAASEVEQKYPVIHNSEVNSYLTSIGEKLAHTKYAGDFPYTFGLIADKAINAFSLPGGPVYVNTGLMDAAKNEAQLAGVLAHEMSHITLRHATNQMSKQNLIQLPAMLAGAMTGNNLMGQLARLGIGLGANSILLKFSRTDESQADYNGALMMYEAGYNPVEMARFFQQLEAQGGRESALSQFLSDHPNPGNRVAAVENEIRQLPPKQFTTNTGQFPHIQDVVRHLAARNQLRSNYTDQHGVEPPRVRPSSRFRQYSTNAFVIGYPENWEVFGDQNSPSVTIASRDALFQTANGGVQIGYGVMISYYIPPDHAVNLERDTNDLIRQLQQQNASMRVRDRKTARVDNQPAIVTSLTSQSPYQGETEVDQLVTVARPEGLFYLVFISPASESGAVGGVLENMLRSLKFR
jgi:Zn-dependent protease with chaperone function